ncbi:MAG: SAM-dependent methyltransferase [Planctomycetaceae bacterium]|nr:SAM-dependent methyltransferase [Planctomycetaceae bacterium]
MQPSSQFLFTVCQVGIEALLKAEMAREWPEFRFSFSRPGFVTFKLPEGFQIGNDFDLRSVFARTFGLSLGRLSGENANALAEQSWEFATDRKINHIHCWQRDAKLPGENGFEPGITPLASEVAATIAACAKNAGAGGLPTNRTARSGQSVLDVALVEPNEWWVGYHIASGLSTRWPGGVPTIDVAGEPVSRAYYKMAEAMRWSRLPLSKGDLCAEIGSAPGGGAQWLLEQGQYVLGIDPAEMDDRILAHREFAHIRRRAVDVPRRDFRNVRWLVADSNVAPKHTLDSVEAVVMHESVRVRGMILTLKLFDATPAAEMPAYLERIRSWGFGWVRARQLAFNRGEFCVAALRNRAMCRFRR